MSKSGDCYYKSTEKIVFEQVDEFCDAFGQVSKSFYTRQLISYAGKPYLYARAVLIVRVEESFPCPNPITRIIW